MKDSPTNINMLVATLIRSYKIIDLVFISVMAFAPFIFGAMLACSEEAVLILTTAIFICFLLKLAVNRDVRFLWFWAYTPLVLFPLPMVVQHIPLPTRIVEAISPNTPAVNEVFLSDFPNQNQLLKSITINYNPNVTKLDLQMIFAIIIVFVVFVVGFKVCHFTQQVKRLHTVIAIIGACVVALVLTKGLLDNENFYWLVDLGIGRDYSGLFVNHDHYSHFMNLSIGTAFGLILVKLSEAFTGKKVVARIVLGHLRSLVKLIPEAHRILDSILEERMCLHLRMQFQTAEKLITNKSVLSCTVFADDTTHWVFSRCIVGSFL